MEELDQHRLVAQRGALTSHRNVETLASFPGHSQPAAPGDAPQHRPEPSKATVTLKVGGGGLEGLF